MTGRDIRSSLRLACRTLVGRRGVGRFLAAVLSAAACLPLPHAMAAEVVPGWPRIAAEREVTQPSRTIDVAPTRRGQLSRPNQPPASRLGLEGDPSSHSGAGAEDIADCWRGFFQAQGIAQPVGEIIAFRFVGQELHIPAAYLWQGLPRPRAGDVGAIRLLAWGPKLAPPTDEQAGNWWRPTSRTVRITMFGHPHFLQGQALVDEFTRGGRYEDGERDAIGFSMLRERLGGESRWSEIHISPQGPDELFHCNVDGSVRYPGCTAERWIGGPLRLETHFQKTFLAEYPELSASLDGFFRCALGTGAAGQVWPPNEGHHEN